MVDISNEGLLNNKNKKNMISFDSISERQEESSYSSAINSKLGKSKATIKNNRSILKQNDGSKDIINISNLSINNQRRRETKYGSLFKKKSVKENQKLEELIKEKELKFRQFKRKETKKKTNQLFMKRISFQHNKNNLSFYNQMKNNEDLRRSSKNMGLSMHSMARSTIKDKKSLNTSDNNMTPSLSFLYNNKNSILGQSVLKNNSINLANSETFLDMKYFNNKNNKKVKLRKGKLNFSEHRNNMQASNLFEKLKESYLYEKSEALLLKIKICYAFLAFFSFLSIFLEIIDVIIFNKKSKEFLDEKYHFNTQNDTIVDHYYFLQERNITKKENTIRVFNFIFSIICFFIHLIIHYIKNNFDKQSQNRNRYNNNYYGYRRKRKNSRHHMKETNIVGNENHMKFLSNDNLVTKNYVTREEIIKLVINCIISAIFYPPGLNKVIIGRQNSIIYVYSLNSIFLFITFFKLINIYFAIYYLSPFNNLLYKTICSSNMIKLDFQFMLRFLLNNFPMYFIIINFIVICLVSCLLLYTIEYFSIDVYNGIWNSKGENDTKNFFNQIYLFCSFILKTVHGNVKTESILGSLILTIGGTVGLIIISYFLYYINILIEFRVEEQQAYTKLIKLLDPLNNEHKASNLLKVFLLMNKMYLDNQNIEENYRIKKDNDIKDMVRKNLGIRKSNLNFGPNESNNSLANVAENNDYKEKKNFIKYLCTKFLLKVKLINEIKNFKNNLIVARNNSLSLNDVLKTLGDKMNGNINQLNNKIEILIQNDEKFKNFMKFQENSLKNIKKIMVFQDFLLDYLIERNNSCGMEYYAENKEKQNNFLNKFKNVGGDNAPRRLKSSFNGPFFNFNKKQNINKNNIQTNENKGKVKQNPKGLFDSVNKKTVYKKLRSSIVGNNPIFNTNLNYNEFKPIPTRKKTTKKTRKKAKSLHENTLNICIKRNVIVKLENDIISNINKKRRSLSNKKNQVIDKFKNKFK